MQMAPKSTGRGEIRLFFDGSHFGKKRRKGKELIFWTKYFVIISQKGLAKLLAGFKKMLANENYCPWAKALSIFRRKSNYRNIGSFGVFSV